MRGHPATALAVVTTVCLTVSHLGGIDGEELSDYLWSKTETYHTAALQSPFIQGLKEVSLDPTDFGVYNLQDAIYMYRVKKSIDSAVGRTSDPGLKKFLQDRSDSYQRYYKNAFNEWHIIEAMGIRLGKACEDYTNHINNVATSMEPIYLVAALIPCARLWPWLGQQIDAGSGKFGVYNKWVAASLDPTYPGYKKYEVVINEAFSKEEMTKEEALQVYGESMKGEVAFFSSIRNASMSIENQKYKHGEF